MGALHAGGLQVIHDPKRTERLSLAFHTGSYDANSAYWEPSRDQWGEWDFPKQYVGDGPRAMKVLDRQIGSLAPAEYEVVVLKRHPEEIRQSLNAMLFAGGGRAPPWLDHDEGQTGRYLDRISWIRDMVELRPDMKLAGEFWYREDVLADPLRVFLSLDWPINPVAAADSIDPSRCRVKLEALTVGI
jgi:hypothetical protein